MSWPTLDCQLFEQIFRKCQKIATFFCVMKKSFYFILRCFFDILLLFVASFVEKSLQDMRCDAMRQIFFFIWTFYVLLAVSSSMFDLREFIKEFAV